jgi:hypothetical protein
MRPWASFEPVLFAAPFNLVDQSAAETQKDVRARVEGLPFNPAQHHGLMALGAVGWLNAHAAQIWRGIRVHRTCSKKMLDETGTRLRAGPVRCYFTSR